MKGMDPFVNSPDQVKVVKQPLEQANKLKSAERKSTSKIQALQNMSENILNPSNYQNDLIN